MELGCYSADLKIEQLSWVICVDLIESQESLGRRGLSDVI